MKEGKKEYVTSTALKVRGWSERLIGELLGAPDQNKPNPHYKSGPMMKFYALDRVIEGEATQEFIDYQPMRARLSAAGKLRAKQDEERLLQAVRTIKFEIDIVAMPELQERAREHWQSLRSYRGDHYADGRDADECTIMRWCVNYLPHVYSDYEKTLDQTFGLVGKNEAYPIIKDLILASIAKAYPELAGECRRQSSSRLA